MCNQNFDTRSLRGRKACFAYILAVCEIIWQVFLHISAETCKIMQKISENLFKTAFFESKMELRFKQLKHLATIPYSTRDARGITIYIDKLQVIVQEMETLDTE